MDNVDDNSSHSLATTPISDFSQPAKALVTKDSTLLECDGASFGVQSAVFQRTTMP